MATYDSQKDAIMVDRDGETGTYEIPGASEIETWGEVCTITDEHGGDWTEVSTLKGWGRWSHCYLVSDPILGDRHYFVE